LEASQKWAAQIKARNMRQMDAWLALRSTIWKTLDYPLTCTTLTKKQCEQIMRPEMSAGLAKSHICRSFPTSLLHTGAEALGAGLPHLFTVQCIALLSTLVSRSPGGSITSCYSGPQWKQLSRMLDVDHLHGTHSSKRY
jgi:hypothetical protein